MKYLTKQYSSIEQLKKDYKSWAKRLHPDVGGSTEEMKILNNEFDEICDSYIFKKAAEKYAEQKRKEGPNNTNKSYYIPKEVAEIIRQIIYMNVTIEIIGIWVWITGKSCPYRKTLTSLGFHWSSSKKAWYYPTTGYIKTHSNKPLNLLRDIYGSETIKTQTNTVKIGINTADKNMKGSGRNAER